MADFAREGLRYDGKVTIVTGGSRGIGQAIVELFASHGSKVVITDIREDLGQELARSVNEKGQGEAFFVKCDLAKEEEIKNVVETAVEKYGRIDCVINNAGILSREYIDDASAESFRKINEINVIAPFLVCKYALPHLRKVKGNIINMGSIVGIIGQKNILAYATSKAAVIGFTKNLAIDEGESGVRVNALAPSPIQSPMFENSMKSETNPKAYRYFKEQVNVLGRIGTVNEVALACLFFAADATFCTGTILPISGGTELDYGMKRGLDEYFNS